ncbi:uncharacterized protein J8A68_003414 [[Candida] subhashii]|uniref:Striatin N-terminal domain-containing protein n=1 Tax=[Candida] subhashii TaxID=561895 RepID=A0A8J5QM37_9ASCO|nr:uncharacterized protein J8A68_003414 [[Candida] subhashii]KAG7663071.1 hypothetical protein J8A68_003414 [[Candida] subhashii]
MASNKSSGSSNSNTNSNGSNNSNNLNPQTQWQQQQQQQQQQNQSVGGSQQVYNLPGVINYLTSEFTNLERYKIMTNIEKSEMKFKIVQLQGEVNSLKFINHKQKVKIDKLEQENRCLKLKLGEEDQKEEVEGGDGDVIVEDSEGIPKIDLSMIKKSKQQLNKSMKEIMNLLKAPSSKNYINLPPHPDQTNTIPAIAPESNEFDVLIDNNTVDNQVEAFLFQEISAANNKTGSNKSNKKQRSGGGDSSVISQFFSDEPYNLDVIESPSRLEIKNGSDEDKESYYDNILVEDGPSEDLSDVETIASTVILEDADDEEEEAEPEEEEREQEQEHVEVDDNGDDEIVGVISPHPSPEPELIDFNDPEYENLDVFDSENVSIYLNSMSATDHTKMTVTNNNIEDDDDNDNAKVLLIKEFDLDIEPNRICNIFPLIIHSQTNVSVFLLIYKNGEVRALIFDSQGGSKQETIINIKSIIKEVLSSSIIEFKNKTNEKSKYIGLAIGGTASNNNQFLLKVYQIKFHRSDNNIQSKEIGSYNKNFLMKGKQQSSASGDHHISFAGWYVNEKAHPHAAPTIPTPLLKGKQQQPNNSSNVSCDDDSLGIYELLYKVDDKTFELNLVSRKSNVFRE